MEEPDMLLVRLADVKDLLSVEDHLPWHERSPLLVALRRAVYHLDALPDAEIARRLTMQRTGRQREMLRNLVASAVLEDRALTELRTRRAALAPSPHIQLNGD